MMVEIKRLFVKDENSIPKRTLGVYDEPIER